MCGSSAMDENAWTRLDNTYFAKFDAVKCFVVYQNSLKVEARTAK